MHIWVLKIQMHSKLQGTSIFERNKMISMSWFISVNVLWFIFVILLIVIIRKQTKELNELQKELGSVWDE